MGASMLQPVPLALIPLLPLYFLGVDDAGAVCIPSGGTTFVCSGDFSSGLNIGTTLPDGTTGVVVRDLTANIDNPTGIVWDLGPTTGPNPPTRTLEVNAGSAVIRSDVPVLLQSQGVTNGPIGSSLGAFGLSLNFFGQIESRAPGAAIFVNNIGNLLGFTLPYGLHGGAVGDISINVGGLISGQAGVRALSVGGHGNWGFPAGNGAAGGNVLFGTGSAGLTVNTLAVDSPAVDAASVGGAGGMGVNTNPGGDGGHGGRGGNFIFEGQTVLNLETFGSQSPGIRFFSQGGGGGNGANVGSGRGGNGGAGGTGGQIATSDLNATITTRGFDSPGLISVSIGGKGGDGGKSGSFGQGGDGAAGGFGSLASITGTFNILTQGKNSDGIAISSVGGRGGEGGDGGFFSGGGDGAGSGSSGPVQISLREGSNIQTVGDNSVGISAQSLGGRAGAGGSSVGLFSFAADGGSAGKAGTINVESRSNITTIGNGATAIFAQSIGGGGGKGGDAFGIYYAQSGKGAIGGAGGEVFVDNFAAINTFGNSASGIQAQSISGTGGSGGTSIGLVALGGRGGISQNAGSVGIFNAGTIETGEGPQGPAAADLFVPCRIGCSHGIIAQSIGGGGGDGGTTGGWFSVGGAAAGGGSGWTVNIQNSADITTHLERSSAIIGQSIGGGGGNGGGAVAGGLAASLAIGGSGGVGGNGSSVELTTQNGSNISTAGNRSSGIVAQSLGGGGGNGGFSASASVGINFPAVAISVGGTGGTGGSAGLAQIRSGTDGQGGTVSTVGNESYGLLAQSIGGGGGNGGFALALSGSNAGSLSVGVGGSGAGGGQGGLADIHNLMDISTRGDRSNAIVAQSIGGGGGNGGASVSAAAGFGGLAASVGIGGKGGAGNSANVALAQNGGNVATAGEQSAGIVVQSIGGGGGQGGLAVAGVLSIGSSAAVSFGLGGSGNAGGNGARAFATQTGTVLTTGDQSAGVIAQSIGGGGGNGGASIAANLSLTQSTDIAAAIGGKGNAGGFGHDAAISNFGDVETWGDNSQGLLAQSLGGGGGNGGLAVAGNLSLGRSNNVSFSLGGEAGTAGSGGFVEVFTTRNVITHGDLSTGVLAQSVGGGGGNGGSSISANLSTAGGNGVGATIGGAAGGAGSGGLVDVRTAGNIATSGVYSDGVLAQSVGGGGGNGGTAISGNVSFGGSSTDIGFALAGSAGDGGAASAVNVDTRNLVGDINSVNVTGQGSRGVVAQSIGGGGGNAGTVIAGNVSGSASKQMRLLIGRTGGSGGASGLVNVDFAGAISTGQAGRDSAADIGGEHGILAQSIGGGGGSGSVALTGSNNQGKRSLEVAIGGRAGLGAGAGLVTVVKSASTTTYGRDSHGIFAQSIGGGGGVGGYTSSFAVPNDDASNFSVAVGGKGGDGNAGGKVVVDNRGIVMASGLGSKGLVAQSIGGGGGAGGSNIVTSLGKDTAASQFQLGVGGAGGAGGAGGNVEVFNTSHIVTGTTGDNGDDGADSPSAGYGILAQSISSGGGTGGVGLKGDLATSGDLSLAVAVGGKGFGAHQAGSVLVNNFDGGTITTHDDGAHGIVAQSIGGGGGDGATGIEGDVSNGSKLGATVAVGGAEGGGGSASGVQVTTAGHITTYGDGAKAIVAQSIGGGGGNAGVGIEGSVEGDSDEGQGQLALAIGGAGAAGGAGGGVTVVVQSNAVIQTGAMADGRESGLGQMDGIFAQSIGGGGGNGGAGISGDITSNSDQKALDIGIGGGSGVGRAGGTVGVTTGIGAVISVAGQGSRGIFAQSVGGGGGNGGAGIDGGIKAGDDTSDAISVNLGIGRRGGSAGAGGEVTVDNSAQIITNNTGAGNNHGNHAIYAQSVGGGGGTGGIGIAGDLEVAKDAKALTVGVGGIGAGASAGGHVSVSNLESAGLQISGKDSTGIFAQSVGGGGGDGQAGINGGIGAADDATGVVQLALGLGGAGGGGGNGGVVTVENMADINGIAGSSNDPAGLRGIVAQSIGGGGGSGGIGVEGTISGSDDSQALAIGIGATGGSGGNAAQGSLVGTITGAGVGVRNEGEIRTTGDASVGILAQSIGGGGGHGAAGLEGDVEAGSGSTIAFALGTKGGSGGSGGTVWVQNLGAVSTTDTLTPNSTWTGSHAVQAQSVGGGGGSGNLTGGLVFGSGGSSKGVSLALGSANGGGSGGNIILENGTENGVPTTSGDVATAAQSSHGLFAQSIGGGGGAAPSLSGIETENSNDSWSAVLNLGATGGSGGNGGSVEVNHGAGNIATLGAGSSAIFAQSIGGGGGEAGQAGEQNATFTLDLGADGVGGNGRPVTINVRGAGQQATSISTFREYSTAIVAQSIGAGGGMAGLGARGQGGSIKLGGTNDAFGSAGTVSMDLRDASISTSQDFSPGVLAQSVGGGGGYAGHVQVSSSDRFGSNLDFGAGSDNRGNGGAINFDLTNVSVMTNGDHSPAIILQSVGGGGGIAGNTDSSASGALFGSAGGSGRASRIAMNLAAGSIVATGGEQSHAVIAQGAGGSGTSTATGADAVNLDIQSTVSAVGAGAHGVFAQSVGEGRGPILVTVGELGNVTGGTEIAGAQEGAAIFLQDGAIGLDPNQIFNFGNIVSSDGEEGLAVKAEGDGRTIFENFGTVIGRVEATPGSRLMNEITGFIQAEKLEVEAVVNEGILDIGPSGATGQTLILGDILQTATGRIEVDLNPNVTNLQGVADDQLLVDGDADLDGFVIVDLLDPFQVDPGRQVVPVILVDNTLLLEGKAPVMPIGGVITELEVTQSAIAQYELVRTGNDEISLGFDIDFANAGILAAANETQAAIAGSVQSIYRAHELDDDAALSLIALETDEEVVRAYSALSGEVFVDNQIASYLALNDFGDALLSCSNVTGRTSERFFDSGRCVYLQVEGSDLERDATSDNLGFDGTNVSLTVGGQLTIGEDWNVGGALRYGNGQVQVNNSNSNSDSDELMAGLSAKRRFGAVEISALGAVGYFDIDNERNPLGLGVINSSQNIWSVAGAVEAAYLIGNDQWFAKPKVSLDVAHFSSSDFTEAGSSSLRLMVDTGAQTYFSLNPAIEFGGEFTLGEQETRVRPHVEIGLTQLLGSATPAIQASFASGGMPSFRTATDMDRTRFEAGAGLDILFGSATLRLDGAASFSENSQIFGGGARLEIPF